MKALRFVGVLAGIALFAWLLAGAVEQEFASAGTLSRAAAKGPTLPERVDGTRAASESASRAASIRAKWPTAEAMRWQPPRGFLRAAFCVHRHESVDWHRAYVDWRGRPSPYSGGMQFLLSTWRRAGGSGHPHEWRPREQVYRAWRIYRLYRTNSRPGSWTEWGTAGKCGLS